MRRDNELLLVAATHDVDAAADLAAHSHGRLLTDVRAGTPSAPADLPFSALACVVTDDVEVVMDVGDIGVYMVCRRVIKPRTSMTTGVQPGVFGVFTMVANPTLGHDAADRHWRDRHAPLALEVHQAMDHYVQLSVVHVLSGPAFDGFALCGFPCLEDLRERFFATEPGRQAIARDVDVFADVKESPRRVIASEVVY